MTVTPGNSPLATKRVSDASGARPDWLGPSDGGGGATYYIETEAVDNESVPGEATVTPSAESPDPVVDAVTASLTGNTSVAEIRREHRDLVPAYVAHEREVYRVDTWHVDHSVHLHWYVALGGGVLALVVGSVGFLVARRRTAS
jgi:hypothetical protein